MVIQCVGGGRWIQIGENSWHYNLCPDPSIQFLKSRHSISGAVAYCVHHKVNMNSVVSYDWEQISKNEFIVIEVMSL
jgi:hypothetical protein